MHCPLLCTVTGTCTHVTTGLLQRLDVAINKAFKEMIQELTNTAILDEEDAETFPR